MVFNVNIVGNTLKVNSADNGIRAGCNVGIILISLGYVLLPIYTICKALT